MRAVLVRYGELALKSEPVRRAFESKLIANIRALLGRGTEIRKTRGRIFIFTDQPKKISKMVSRVPGVVSCSPALVVPADIDAIVHGALRVARSAVRGKTFAVRTRRHGSFPLSSQQVNERVGAEILRGIPDSRVNLDRPDIEVSIEIWDERAYIFTETVQGMGGLPVGTQGKVLVWLDGTRSSFEAAKLALKRGCEVEVLAVGKKAMQSARRLLAHHSRITVHFIPLDGIENSSKDGTLSYWVRQAVLGEVAKRRNASAVVVPDTAGTLLSLGLTTAKSLDELAGVLVLRPLLGASLIKLEKPPPTRPRVTPTDNWQRKAAKILSKIRTEVLRLKT